MWTLLWLGTALAGATGDAADPPPVAPVLDAGEHLVDPESVHGAFHRASLTRVIGTLRFRRERVMAQPNQISAYISPETRRELWHACNNTLFDAIPGSYPCSKAKNLEHSFTWAISFWYPSIVNSNGCATYQDDDWWYNTGAKGMFARAP